MRIQFGQPDPWDQFAEPNLRVIQYNDQGGHGYTRAWMCPFCSALVLDGPSHERWHIAVTTTMLPAAAPDEHTHDGVRRDKAIRPRGGT